MMNKPYALELKPIARAGAVITGEKYRITVLTDSLIRLEYQEQGRFVDEPTQTVICREFPDAPFRVLESPDSLEIVTDKLHLYYDKKPFSNEGLRIDMKGDFHHHGSTWSYGDEIEDLRGTVQTLDKANGAVPLEPGLMSRDGFTVLDDSRSAFIGADQWPAAKDWESQDLYFFGYGHDYLRCLKDFYRLSGATPLLPRFALGNWWSRYYRYSEESYLKLMNQFREKGIPFSTAVIDMDWHLTDIPARFGSGWTGYTWNRQLFPDPKRFMDKLHEMGMQVTLNVHPADGVRPHEEAYLPMAKELGIDYENEDSIPFNAASREYLNAYFKYLHHPNEEQGVDFWWLDWQQGTRGSAKGIDTLWLLNHLHYLDNGRSGKMPLTFSRYAGPGSHRYPVGFSGDTHITWESLDFQPYFTANASNIGYSWWSHDIGGHMLGYRDDELSVRWLQFGVFSPIMRLHSTSNEFCGKEPWNYNMAAEAVMTEFLRLRHKLIPYLHSMNYLTSREGLPLMLPMYYRHDVNEAYNVPNEYWFGTEMIVCPITKPADPESLHAEFDAWLPEGDWFDFFTGRHYRGGRKIKLYRNLTTIPVLVRSGGIVPLAVDYEQNHIHNPEELEIQVFQGASGSFDLYEDRDGACAVTRLAFTSGKTATLTVRQEGEISGVIPENRRYCFRFRGMAKPVRVLLNGCETAWEYEEEKPELRINTAEAGDFEIQIELTDDAIVSADPRAAVYDILHRAQIAYGLKSGIYEAVCRDQNPVRLMGILGGMDMPDSLRGAIAEQMIAPY